MASKPLKAKKNEYSALQTTDIEDYPGGAVTFYKTKNLLESSRGAYLCRFACAFDELSDEQVKENLKARKQLWTASIFCFMFMCAEFIGGYFAHSLALMSDASHLLSDLGSLMVSIFALWLTSKRSSDRLSFGYHRAEILGALLSAFVIWGLTVFLVYKAVLFFYYLLNLICLRKIVPFFTNISDGNTQFLFPFSFR
ncbi:solute carrier family protein [Reticulomyxa filosa]|uniref:Solute carrier family protein n=1 Tax=Reticulomyxa filosa TaxID=46433 RepID=X6PH26_RETFI|nr:solute carrier family protein [Reticulomyxa filosa]|eukprot:ETO36992.1 solute carrier family protein [Reticulomyxa filosa]